MIIIKADMKSHDYIFHIVTVYSLVLIVNSFISNLRTLSISSAFLQVHFHGCLHIVYSWRPLQLGQFALWLTLLSVIYGFTTNYLIRFIRMSCLIINMSHKSCPMFNGPRSGYDSRELSQTDYRQTSRHWKMKQTISLVNHT